MKKKLMLLVIAAFVLASFTACSEKKEENDKIRIVTTIFPEYDWVREVVKGREQDLDITFLMGKGADLHSFQPSVSDIAKISKCDLFIYVGGESEEWVEKVLKQAENKDMKVIDLMEVLGDDAKAEEVVEGMQDEDEHDHDHDHEDGEEGHDHHHEGGEIEYDEHVWLSLRNAQKIVKAIEAEIEKLDPAGADTYKKNTNAYVEKLNALDTEYKSAVAAGTKKTVLFGDRFPFRYLVDDYDLKYYAAFVGCSAETEASFETIAFLAGKVDELGLHTILAIEGRDHKIADTVAKTAKKVSDISVATMNSMQGTTETDAKNGATYYSIMHSNLEVLRKALQ